MMISLYPIAFAVAFSQTSLRTSEVPELQNNPEGTWRGIEIFQDESSYDGKTFYLPNNETIIIDKERLRTYYYPYSRIDEFKLTYNSKRIRYKMPSGYTESYYSVSNDTLTLRMHFINKVFIKVYIRTSVEQSVIAELDQFGFNPSAVPHEMELDTFHIENRFGFDNYDSLQFDPFNHIQFIGDEKIKINRDKEVAISRGYKTISFLHDGKKYEFAISHSEGTQSIQIVPKSQCGCDNIIIPYITVSWANRIRKAIEDDLNWE